MQKKAEDAECDYQKRSKSKVFSVLMELTYNCSENVYIAIILVLHVMMKNLACGI